MRLQYLRVGDVWTFFLSSIFSLFFLPLWETARYRLKYCLKRPLNPKRGWSGGAKVHGKIPEPGRPTISNTVGQGPTALAVGAGGGCLDICTLIYPFSSLSSSLWETARYRLKYCLKGPLNPKQPTNQPNPKQPTNQLKLNIGSRKLDVRGCQSEVRCRKSR